MSSQSSESRFYTGARRVERFLDSPKVTRVMDAATMWWLVVVVIFVVVCIVVAVVAAAETIL